MDKNIRLAGIAYESLVNGPGIRRVFFSQGCRHKCRGCFNPDTHDFLGGEIMDMEKLIKDVEGNPLLDGITFSGGDPFEQADKIAYMAENFKKIGLNMWAYSGYKFEYILEHLDEREGWRAFLNCLDVLVDGRFEENLKKDGLRFRGSTNQRIIDVQESLRENKVVTLEY